MDTKIATLASLTAMLLATTSATAQKADEPFLKIGPDVTTWGEFNHLFEQNSNASLLPIGREEYAAIFTNYKLKVAEAKALGLDTTEAYRNESDYYIGELAKNYLQDTTAVARFARRAHARGAEEIHASHILVTCRPQASPADTLAAYNRVAAARERILAGEDFATVAREMSEDPSAKNNAGDLGYFSSLQMVEQFEDMAFSTPVGQTSEVFRTRFGFHCLHVYDRRTSEGEVRVKHIMKLVPKDAPDDKAAKAQIDSIYDAIVNHGADFDEMARKFSDDRQSSSRGGLMPWFTRNQILPEFATASFNLQADGDICAPVRTAAGWHIIRRVGRRAQKPQEEYDTMIRRAQGSNAMLLKAPKRSRMAQLAKEYAFTWDAAGRDTLIGIMLQSSLPSERTASLKAHASQSLATLNGKTLTVADAIPYINKWMPNGLPSENALDIAYAIINDYEKNRLAQKYPEYKFTSAEYRDGLLVFDLMQRKLWSETPDSTTIANQYASHPERYAIGGKFEGEIYFCPTIKAADKVRKLAAKGQKAKAAQLAIKVVSGPIAQGDIYDDILWPVTPANPYVVAVGQTTNGQTQKLSECRSRVISDLQQIAERKLTDSLRQKYQPKQLIKIK